MWMVRNPNGKHAEELLERGVVGIGWEDTIFLTTKAKTPQDYYAAVRQAIPTNNDQQVVNAGRQLYKFCREMKIGDIVVTYDSPRRTYHIGEITSDAQIDEKAPFYLANYRSVKWKQQVERDRLSQATRNRLGSTLTVFQPADEAVEELLRVATNPATPAAVTAEPNPEMEAEDPYVNAQENARELIKDRLTKLDWKEMQELVAGILRAMGYKTKVSPVGSDRGKDIIASPDGLGLEQPRIFVEVKHRIRSPMGSQNIRTFIGGRDPQNDRCLYVSTGGFSQEARYEAERSKVPLTLLEVDDLVELLVENYENVDAETRTLMPLRRTYWPA